MVWMSQLLDYTKKLTKIENVWSELSITNDNSVIAHTKGRSVLRPELKITGENEVDELRITPPGAWKGSELETMNKATRECIREGKERNLGVLW